MRRTGAEDNREKTHTQITEMTQTHHQQPFRADANWGDTGLTGDSPAVGVGRSLREGETTKAGQRLLDWERRGAKCGCALASLAALLSVESR